MKNFLQFLFLISFGCSAFIGQGQITLERQVIANAGSFDTAGDISLSWTLGETITETVSGGTLILTQGFQQPDPEEIDPNAVKEIPLEALGIKVFPNPASMEVVIQASKPDELPLGVQLFGMSGQLVLTQKLIGPNTTLNVGDLPDGVYILRFLTPDNLPVAPVKLQKASAR